MDPNEKPPLLSDSGQTQPLEDGVESPRETFLTEKSEVNPIPEGGWGWLCVLGRFYIHFLLLGSMSAFGIIYIELIDYFHTNRTETAWVGSLAGGLSMFVGPVSGFLTEKLGCRVTTILGAIIAAFGIFVSWWATGIIYLCITYGVIAGCGLGLMFIPSAVIIFQYFVKRRGFASAIGSTGGGIGAMVLPLVYAELIKAFGWRGSMWIISGLTLNAVVCGALFRTPEYLRKQRSKIHELENEKKTNRTAALKDFFSVFKNLRFVLFFFGALFCHFGYAVPIVHMPDLACQRGVHRDQVAYLLSIMGITSVCLRIPIAWASDYRPASRTLVLGIALLICGIGTVLCPHLYSFTSFAVYSAVQGGCMGIWGAFIGVIVADIVGLPAANRGIGFLILSGGLATIISSPLAGWMYDITSSYVASFYFAGIVYLLAGLCTLCIFIINCCKRRTLDSKLTS